MFVINISAIIAVAVKIRTARGRKIVVRVIWVVRIVRNIRQLQPGSRNVGRLLTVSMLRALPQKYIQLRGYGFAAGCEAVTLPRRRGASLLHYGLRPRAENLWGKPEPGA